MITLLTQIPFNKLKDDSLTVTEIQKHILEPIKTGLTFLQSDKFFKLLVILSKITMATVDQYPELSLEGLTLFTRARWPCKMLVVPTLVMFPWSKFSDPAHIEMAFREVYHLYNRGYSTLNELEKTNHQNDFVNKYLIPHMSIIQQVYSIDTKLKLANNGLTFPIVKLFAQFALADKSRSAVATDMSHLLFNLAYKTGTIDRNALPLLAKLRVEACEQIQYVCSQLTIGTISTILNQIFENVAFFMSTQPSTMTVITNMLLQCNLKQWALDTKDVELIEKMLLGKVLAVQTVNGAADAAIKIARNVIENITWETQSQVVNFYILESLLKHSANASASEWVSRIISGSIGLYLTQVHDIIAAEQFLNRIFGKYDEFHLSLSVLISLGICQKRICNPENSTSNDVAHIEQDIVLNLDSLTISNQQQLDDRVICAWKEMETKFGIRKQLALLSDATGIFLPSILKKYIACLAYLDLKDTHDFLDIVSLVISKHVAKERFLFELFQLIHLQITDANYSKTLHLWSVVLVRNVCCFLKSYVCQHLTTCFRLFSSCKTLIAPNYWTCVFGTSTDICDLWIP